jgi:hypothetical protein
MEDNCDNRLFTASVVCEEAPRRCKIVGQRVLGLDSTGIKHMTYRGQLLTIEGKDGDGDSVLIAFKMCLDESAKCYTSFFNHEKGYEEEGEAVNAWMNSVDISPMPCCVRIAMGSTICLAMLSVRWLLVVRWLVCAWSFV